MTVESLKLGYPPSYKRHPTMTSTQTWYIVKLPDGHCEIVSDEQVNVEPDTETRERWGPFSSHAEAIARRIGLIRAGKCQPV
jgi:hypothetical protein